MMKKFIKKTILFFIISLLLAIPADIFISKHLKSLETAAMGEISIWKDIYSGTIDSDLLIYGSSRAWVHFSPDILEKKLNLSAYNLGIDGHNFWLQYLRHRIYSKHNTKPKYILLSLDSFSLEKNKDLYNFEQFLPYMLFDKDIIEYTSSYNGFSKADYYLPFYRYINQSINYKELEKYDSSKKRIKGYMGQNQEWNNDFNKAKKENEYHAIKLDNKSIDLFKKFIEETKKDKIKLIFVYSPEHKLGQKFMKNRKEIIAMYKKFSKDYNIPFLDYSDDEICNNKSYFYNTLHLNKRGSELFSKKLANDIKTIINE